MIGTRWLAGRGGDPVVPLLVASVVMIVAVGYSTIVIQHGRSQQQIVHLIESRGGNVSYAHEYDTHGRLLKHDTRGRIVVWLEAVLGDNLFATVCGVSTGPRWCDDDMPCLTRLPGLCELTLSGSEVTDRGLVHISTLRKLTCLGVADTRITDSGLAHLKELRSLQYLFIQGTNITGSGLQDMPCSVENLYARDTPLGDVGLARLAESDSLVSLQFCWTQVSDTGAPHLALLSKLEYLDISGTRITDAGLLHIAKLSRLRQLDISDTSCSDAGLMKLAELPMLELLELEGTRVTEEGIQAFLQLRPKCRIIGGDNWNE